MWAKLQNHRTCECLGRSEMRLERVIITTCGGPRLLDSGAWTLSCGEGFRKTPLGGHLRTYWREDRRKVVLIVQARLKQPCTRAGAVKERGEDRLNHVRNSICRICVLGWCIMKGPGTK